MVFEMTREEFEYVGHILAEYSERANYPITLDALLTSWKDFVLEVESGYSYSIYEYFNDLSTRNILQEIIERLNDSLGSRIEGVIRSYDERFMTASEPAVKSLYPDKNTETSLWFERIPVSRGQEFEQDLISEGYLEV